ncbi:hypothetical protein [Luteibacter sp. E-22]|uniref:hypothetical protein n=1 Tax=Luteibacter sp. E-22 TaxID=3404050 RepID=UPI003CF68EB7
MNRRGLAASLLLALSTTTASAASPNTAKPVYAAHISRDGAILAGADWIGGVTIETRVVGGSAYHLVLSSDLAPFTPLCTASSVTDDLNLYDYVDTRIEPSEPGHVTVNLHAGSRLPGVPSEEVDRGAFHLLCVMPG